MSCQRCSIGLSQFRLLQNVPGTSARRRELNSQGVTGNGPKIVHRQPPGQSVPLVSSPSDGGWVQTLTDIYTGYHFHVSNYRCL